MSLRVTPHMTAMALPVDWMVESIIIFSRSLHCTWMLWMMGFTHASTFSRFLSEKKIALFKCWSIIHDHQEIKFNDIKLVPKFIEHTRRRPASAVVWMFLVAVVHWNRWWPGRRWPPVQSFHYLWNTSWNSGQTSVDMASWTGIPVPVPVQADLVDPGQQRHLSLFL